MRRRVTDRQLIRLAFPGGRCCLILLSGYTFAMRLRSIAMMVTVLAVAMAGCSDDTSTEPGTVATSEPAPTSTSEPASVTDDDDLEALRNLLAEQGIDESLATFGVDWCTHQDLAMLARDVGGMELAERVAAAASDSAC